MAKDAGLAWLPSIPYPSKLPHGYWEPVTSTINWCEEDYYMTVYSAEIVNTLTNLLFMYLAVKGILNCVRNGHDTIFLIAFVGYLLVGSGSFAFHATLKYPMQLVDELSMIYTTCLMAFATFSHNRSSGIQVVLGTFLVALALFITLYYHYLQDPKFHQDAYAILTAIVLVRCMYVMELNIRPRWRAKARAVEQDKRNISSVNGNEDRRHAERTQLRKDERDKKILKTMWIMIACGMSTFLAGFGIWTLDNTYCSQLRRWRRQVGLPWGLLLEGHGWWHLMTGVGAYIYIVWGIWLRHCLNGKEDQYELDWPRIGSLPSVVLARKVANGDAKKIE